MEISVEKIAQITGHSGSIYTLFEEPERSSFYSAGSEGIVAEWSLDDFSFIEAKAKADSTIYSLLRIANSPYLFIGQSNGGIHITDIQQKKEIKHLKMAQKGIFTMINTPYNRFCLAGSEDGFFSVIDCENLSVIKNLKLTHGKIRKIYIHPITQHIIVSSNDGFLRQLHCEDYHLMMEIKISDWGVNCTIFNPSNHTYICGSRDAHLRVLDENFSLKEDIPAHNYAIYEIIELTKQGLFATASRDKTIKLWSSEFEFLQRINKEKHDGHTHSVNCMVWSQHKNLLISAGDDKKIMVWNITNKNGK